MINNASIKNRTNIKLNFSWFGLMLVLFFIKAWAWDVYSCFFPLSLINSLVASSFFVSLLVFVLYGANNNRITIPAQSLWWLLFAFLVFFNRNADIKNGNTKTTLFYIAAILFLVILPNSLKWIPTFIRILELFSLIYAVATILFFAFPNLYPPYSSLLWEHTKSPFLSGYKSGLTGHYSTNAIYLSTGFIAYLTEFLTKKNRNSIKLILSLIVLFALLLTTKRAHLVFSILALTGVYYFYTRKIGAILKSCSIILVLFILLLVLSNFIPQIFETINRFQESDGTFGNRLPIYQVAFDMFKQSPLIGNGWNSALYATSGTSLAASYGVEAMAVHNVYLQLLAEMGLLGFVIIIYVFISTFIIIAKFQKKVFEKKILITEFENCWLLFSLGYQLFFFLYCITGNPLTDSSVFLPYFCSCAIGLGLLKKYAHISASAQSGNLKKGAKL